MFRNFIILASVAGALTMTAASPSAQAQGLNDDRSYDQFCRDLNSDTGFADSAGNAQQAQKEFQQAEQYDALAAGADANAAGAGNAADRAEWKARANEHRAQANRLRDSAKRNLERSKEARAKFRNNCDLSDESFASLDAYVGTLIQSAEIAADPDKEPVEEEKYERPKNKTAEKATTENRKSAEKSGKSKRKVATETQKTKKQRRKGIRLNSEAVAAIAGIALGVAAEKVSRDHHHDVMSEGHGEEGMVKNNMMSMKKMKKHRKLHKLGSMGRMVKFAF